nr:unnamed protein product [Spirometra erinaceieuropaei]
MLQVSVCSEIEHHNDNGNHNLNVQGVATSSDSIRATWTQPSNLNQRDMQDYLVQLKGPHILRQSSVQPGKTTYAFTGLTPFTNFTVAVKIRFRNASTPFQFAGMPITTWPTAGQKVQRLRLLQATLTIALLSWSQPEFPNGIISKYHVEVKNALTGQARNLTTADPNITLTHLEPSTTYTISVSVENQQLHGKGGGVGEAVSMQITTEGSVRLACGIQELTPSAWPSHRTSRREAIPHSWPWTVGLYASVRGGYPYCGGTLVAPDWVITAAHCVEMAMKCIPVPVEQPFSYKALTNATLFARMGDHSLARTEASERDRVVQNVITHPQYRSGSSENDIALLHLEKPIVPDTAVGFICLPNSDSIVNTSKACAYAGWGSSIRSRIFGYQNAQVLMEGSVTIKSQDFCKTYAQGPKSEGQACLATQTGNPCWGDSGAGVYCSGAEGAWFLYGVLNRGDFLCGGPFATSTNIFPHLEWITKIVAPKSVY